MGLIYERKQAPGEPGTHAFVVGVGDYPWIDRLQLGLEGQLTAPSRSAIAFAAWLTQQYANSSAPLASVRMLLSPPPDSSGHPAFAAAAGPATTENFLEDCSDWAMALSTHEENVGIFLFCGYGMGLNHDQRILALHEIGRHAIAPYQGSVSLTNIHRGMAPSERWPRMSRKQMFFVDASSLFVPLPEYGDRNSSHIFAVSFPTMVDNRDAPLFFSSTPGGMAWAMVDGLSLFVEALLQCLAGEGAVPRRGPGNALESDWVVTSGSLASALIERGRQLSAQHGLELGFSIDSLFGNTTIHELKEKPRVRVRLNIDPGEPGPVRVEIADIAGGPVVAAYDIVGPGEILELLAGFYLFKVDRPAGQTTQQLVLVQPPELSLQL